MSGAARDPRRIVAVTGLAFEARIASRSGVRTIVGAGDSRRLALSLEHEVARGACAIISFGIAGGLAEDALPGRWVVARSVVSRGHHWPTDSRWTLALCERLSGALTGDLAGDDAIVTEPQRKRAWHRATGACAIDTESHVAAAVAAAHALPFAAFRVVADPVARALPAAALRALRPDGRVNGAAVLRSLLRAPRQLPALLLTAFDAQAALRALSRGRRLIGAGLGYPDLHELLLDVA